METPEEFLKHYHKDLPNYWLFEKRDVVAGLIKEYVEKSSNWISVKDRLPDTLETVWISNGKGWTTLGCRSDLYEGDNNDLIWCWCYTNGVIYEEDGKIQAECEADDIEVRFWQPLPEPPKQ